MHRGLLPLIACCRVAMAEEIAFPSPAAAADAAFPLGNGALFTRLAGDAKSERLPLWTVLDEAARPADPQRPALGFTGSTRAELVFDWLDAEAPVTDYRRRLDFNDGLAIVTFKRGGAGFTWTTFISRPDDLLVLHLRTDKPGFLSFRVQLEAGEMKAAVEERRMLSLRRESFAARAWVYPMESEVTPGDREITVRGEGEALVLLAATADAEKIPRLGGRITKLAGERHPDTFALWSGLLARQREHHRKAMAGGGLKSYLEAVAAD